MFTNKNNSKLKEEMSGKHYKNNTSGKYDSSRFCYICHCEHKERKLRGNREEEEKYSKERKRVKMRGELD